MLLNDMSPILEDQTIDQFVSDHFGGKMSEQKFYPIVFDEQSFEAIKDCVAWCANNRPIEPSDRTYLMDLSNTLAQHVPETGFELVETEGFPDVSNTSELSQDQIREMIACLQNLQGDIQEGNEPNNSGYSPELSKDHISFSDQLSIAIGDLESQLSIGETAKEYKGYPSIFETRELSPEQVEMIACLQKTEADVESKSQYYHPEKITAEDIRKDIETRIRAGQGKIVDGMKFSHKHQSEVDQQEVCKRLEELAEPSKEYDDDGKYGLGCV